MGDIWGLVAKNVFKEVELTQMAARGILILANFNYNVDDIYISYYKLGVAVKLEGALRIIHITIQTASAN